MEEVFQAVDLMIKRDDEGVYDLVIENGKFKDVNSFDTAFSMIIHCERRADPSEVPTPELRRGWWGNLILSDVGFEQGSKLWLLYQERRTQDILNKAVNFVQQACEWLVEDGHLRSVDVSGELVGQGGIGLNIKYLTFDNKIEARYYEMWRNTGRSYRVEKLQALPNLIIERMKPVSENDEEGVQQFIIGGQFLLENGAELLLDRKSVKRI